MYHQSHRELLAVQYRSLSHGEALPSAAQLRNGRVRCDRRLSVLCAQWSLILSSSVVSHTLHGHKGANAAPDQYVTASQCHSHINIAP